MPFLTAEWRKLAIANYEIDPDILSKYLPPKTELDLWRGKCYVSLVGFMFLNTKLLGLPIPFHRNFEEVNLRFYVRHKHHNEWKRGVVFIKEIVPKYAITFVANTLYKEHYQTMKMSHAWKKLDNCRIIKYLWRLKDSENSILLKTSKEAITIETDSETEFITEHYWGYTKAANNTTFEYEVTHPRWLSYAIAEYQINVNFGLVYGNDFAQLANQQPTSVMLAEGSEITIGNKRKI